MVGQAFAPVLAVGEIGLQRGPACRRSNNAVPRFDGRGLDRVVALVSAGSAHADEQGRPSHSAQTRDESTSGGGLLGGLLEPVTPVVSSVSGVTDPIVSGVSRVAAPVVEPVVGVAEPVTAPLLAPVTEPLSPVLEVLAPVTEPLWAPLNRW